MAGLTLTDPAWQQDDEDHPGGDDDEHQDREQESP